MNAQDREFLNDMAIQLDEAIKKLAIEELTITEKLGKSRVEELMEFWELKLSEEDERYFRRTMDHWDKDLIRIWSRTKKLRLTRVQVGHTFMKSPL
ncbi:MAG: hypothetical protein NTZ45_00315 [Methylococcales bacterium]|jgi:hypothetical protein|nr:hypothetical protein [Methylococcales bacterium]